MQFSQIPVSVIQRIISLCAFIWKSKAHKMCWDDVYRTKNEGGFGIRKIYVISKVVAIKLVWKFIQGDTLWAKWMYRKYCSKTNFWTVELNNNTSYTGNYCLELGNSAKD